MTTNLAVFNFDSHDVRVVNNDPLKPEFVAYDVARALGYKQHKQAVRQHCKGDVKRVPLFTSGGTQKVLVIGEANLYRLIFGSKLESAIRFQDWVFNEVLPAIRKTGRYETPKPPAGLFPYQQRAVQKRVSWLVKNQVGTTYTGIYGQIKDKFHVGSYKDVPQEQFPMLCQFLNMPVPEAIEHDQPDLIGVGWSQHEKLAYLNKVASSLDLAEPAVFMTYSDVKRIYERAENTARALMDAMNTNKETLVLCEKYPDLLNARPLGSKTH